MNRPCTFKNVQKKYTKPPLHPQQAVPPPPPKNPPPPPPKNELRTMEQLKRDFGEI